MTQTYCDRDDIEDIWSDVGVLMRIDDDEDGSEDAAETARVTSCIESAAADMNYYIEQQYGSDGPASLASNVWCKWCNAYLAAYELGMRRGNPVPEFIEKRVQRFLQALEAVANGLTLIPQADPAFDSAPCRVDVDVDISKVNTKVRRIAETSTGSPPPDGLKDFVFEG